MKKVISRATLAALIIAGVLFSGCDKKAEAPAPVPPTQAAAPAEGEKVAAAPAEAVEVVEADEEAEAETEEGEAEEAEKESAAVITEVKGGYFVYEGEAETPVWGSEEPKSETGFELVGGQRVKTAEKSEITIKFEDGSIAKMGQNTELTIDSSDPKREEGISLALILGSLYSEVSKVLGGEKKYTVTTPTAVAGVRGTKFSVGVAECCSSLITVEEGQVEVDVETAAVELGPNTAVELPTEEVIKPEFKPKVTKIEKKPATIHEWREKRAVKIKKEPEKHLKAIMTLAQRRETSLSNMISEGEKMKKERALLASRLKIAQTPEEKAAIGAKLAESRKQHKELAYKVRLKNGSFSGSTIILNKWKEGKVAKDKQTQAKVKSLVLQNQATLNKLQASRKEHNQKTKVLFKPVVKKGKFMGVKQYKLKEPPAHMKKQVKEKEKATQEEMKKKMERDLKKYKINLPEKGGKSGKADKSSKEKPKKRDKQDKKKSEKKSKSKDKK